MLESFIIQLWGGWFDLDCFILRYFDPPFYHYGKEIGVYQWENKNYPNGEWAIHLLEQYPEK